MSWSDPPDDDRVPLGYAEPALAVLEFLETMNQDRGRFGAFSGLYSDSDESADDSDDKMADYCGDSVDLETGWCSEDDYYVKKRREGSVSSISADLENGIGSDDEDAYAYRKDPKYRLEIKLPLSRELRNEVGRHLKNLKEQERREKRERKKQKKHDQPGVFRRFWNFFSCKKQKHGHKDEKKTFYRHFEART